LRVRFDAARGGAWEISCRQHVAYDGVDYGFHRSITYGSRRFGLWARCNLFEKSGCSTSCVRGHVDMKTKVHLAEYRDRVYAKYPDKHVGWQNTGAPVYRRWAKGAAAHLRGWLPKDKSAACLDLGCGPGNLLYMLRELGYRNTTVST